MWTDEWMDGMEWKDERMSGRMNAWMDGWMEWMVDCGMDVCLAEKRGTNSI